MDEIFGASQGGCKDQEIIFKEYHLCVFLKKADYFRNKSASENSNLKLMRNKEVFRSFFSKKHKVKEFIESLKNQS